MRIRAFLIVITVVFVLGMLVSLFVQSETLRWTLNAVIIGGGLVAFRAMNQPRR